MDLSKPIGLLVPLVSSMFSSLRFGLPFENLLSVYFRHYFLDFYWIKEDKELESGVT